MNREEKIKYLEKFKTLIDEWLELRQKGDPQNRQHQILIELASLWGVVSEILKGLDYKLEIELDDDNRGKNIKPKLGDLFHNGIYASNNTWHQSTHILTLHSYILGAIEKVKQGVIVRENVLPNLNLLISVLNTFSEAVSRLRYRRKGKNAVNIDDEYDVQDILYVMMKGPFSTLQYEDPTQKEGPVSAKADFVISDINTYIEAKYIGKKGEEKSVFDECLTDIQKYGSQPDCFKIVFFVYDPNKCIDNQFSFRSALNKSRTIEGKELEVLTLIIN